MNQHISKSPRVAARSLQRKIAVNVSELRTFAESAVRACLRLAKKNASNLAALDEVSIIIISDRRMAELHQGFMNQPGPTDVITFQHGEIFISADTAIANAKRLARRSVANYGSTSSMDCCTFRALTIETPRVCAECERPKERCSTKC